jgi:DNA-binding transcriptional LysR family regulator
VPKGHVLARKARVRVIDLRDEPFVLFARRMGPLAFDRTVACCERNGVRPRIVQEAPQWSTLVRLVAAGLGVSLAPACVATVAIPGALYRDVDARCTTTVDLAIKAGGETALVANFVEIARKHMAK